MKKKIVFGMLVTVALFSGSMMPVVSSETLGQYQNWYWIVTSVRGDVNYYEPSDPYIPGYKNQYISLSKNYMWMPISIDIACPWWQDNVSPSCPVEQMGNGWRIQTNCKIKATDGLLASDYELLIELYHPSNIYPEYINFTIRNGKERVEEARFYIYVSTDNDTDPTWELTLDEFSEDWDIWHYKNLKSITRTDFEIDFYDIEL